VHAIVCVLKGQTMTNVSVDVFCDVCVKMCGRERLEEWNTNSLCLPHDDSAAADSAVLVLALFTSKSLSCNFFSFSTS
jgi:hypothetical protein